MSVLKAYRFKIYPDEAQKQFFMATFGCVRFTYNHLLVASQQKKEQKLTPAKLKKDYPFLKETDSLALANAQRNLEKAFRRYFTGKSDFPKFKHKSNPWQSYTTNNQGHTIYLKEGQLKLPKLKSLVKVNYHREITGQIKSATISAKNNTDFYVSILCVEEIPSLPQTSQSITIAYSPSELLEGSQSLLQITFNQDSLVTKIDKVQKKLKIRAKVARKNRIPLAEAKNYQKLKERLARLQVSQKEKKEDFFDQLSYYLVCHFDQITVDAKIIENNHEACAVVFTKADWHCFYKKLVYKSNWYGKKLIDLD
ncbi:MAG: helix-turn-helix domain-containing protein [Enterococcus sp.]|jgi:putative transposase|nr:helix-turn-helix domain-containing protein [Enterococcus sp.]